MNALSSIRQLWSSMPASPLGPADRSAASPTSIPAAELRELRCRPSRDLCHRSTTSRFFVFPACWGQMVQDVNAKQNVATQSLQDLQSGQNVSLHQTMIAMEEASVSFS